MYQIVKVIIQGEIKSLIHYKTSQKIDNIAVYVQKINCLFDDLYAEFQVICNKYNVKILTINRMKEI